jgi:uncharacterized protein (DUF952 family)
VRPTYHLIPTAAWEALEPGRPYEAASLAREGFVHCTDGADELVATANRHYRDDERAFLVLTIDLDATGSPWRIEDERGIYPHVFGPIEWAAIVRRAPAPRDAAGLFLPLDD